MGSEIQGANEKEEKGYGFSLLSNNNEAVGLLIRFLFIEIGCNDFFMGFLRMKRRESPTDLIVWVF